MRTQIFISYRREGGESLARVFYDRLLRDGYNVFLDVESLRSGSFNEALYAKIEEATDFLLILPPNALDRCSDPTDWVRLEIEYAFQKDKNIIPVMMRNFEFPEAGLPETLIKLPNQNGITANMELFDAVYERLKTKHLHSKPKKLPATWRIAGSAIIAVFSVIFLVGRLAGNKNIPEIVDPVKPAAYQEQAEKNWKTNVLMFDKNDVVADLGGYRSSVEIVPVFGSGILRSEIRAVKFLSSTETAPGASWDVSAAQDGSVLAWVEQTEHGMYALYIAADGGVNGKLSCKDLFCGYANLTEVNFNDSFHTEESVDMSRMFYGCHNLQTLDLTGIQTTNAENLSEMFSGCAALEVLDVSGFVTDKVTDMSGMFYQCESLNMLDITTFATYNVKNVSYMFYGCGAEVDLSQFNTSKVLYATAFMEDDAQVEGIAWEDWLGIYDWEPRTRPQRITTHSWDTGSMILRVMDNSRIRIELVEKFLQETQEEKSMWLHLYHDAGINNGYEIQIKNKNGVLSSNCSYLLWGSAANSHYPEDFTWWVEEDVLIMELKANGKEPAGMYTLQAVQIEQEDSMSAVYSGKMSNAVSSVQFQHFMGPDQEAGGEVTENAVIIGLNFAGEPVWTHLTDVKYEHAQSDKLSEVGYINNRYYYMDEDDMVILDAETGEIQRVVSNIGSAFTDVDVSADGKIYLCCYWDPWFTAMLPDGTVLHQIRAQGSMHFWSSSILVRGDKAYISFGTDINGTVLEVDLTDYSYRFA